MNIPASTLLYGLSAFVGNAIIRKLGPNIKNRDLKPLKTPIRDFGSMIAATAISSVGISVLGLTSTPAIALGCFTSGLISAGLTWIGSEKTESKSTSASEAEKFRDQFISGYKNALNNSTNNYANEVSNAINAVPENERILAVEMACQAFLNDGFLTGTTYVSDIWMTLLGSIAQLPDSYNQEEVNLPAPDGSNNTITATVGKIKEFTNCKNNIEDNFNQLHSNNSNIYYIRTGDPNSNSGGHYTTLFIRRTRSNSFELTHLNSIGRSITKLSLNESDLSNLLQGDGEYNPFQAVYAQEGVNLPDFKLNDSGTISTKCHGQKSNNCHHACVMNALWYYITEINP